MGEEEAEVSLPSPSPSPSIHSPMFDGAAAEQNFHPKKVAPAMQDATHSVCSSIYFFPSISHRSISYNCSNLPVVWAFSVSVALHTRGAIIWSGVEPSPTPCLHFSAPLLRQKIRSVSPRAINLLSTSLLGQLASATESLPLGLLPVLFSPTVSHAEDKRTEPSPLTPSRFLALTSPIYRNKPCGRRCPS